MPCDDQVEAAMVSAHFPPLGRRRVAEKVAEQLTRTEVPTDALSTWGAWVNGRPFERGAGIGIVLLTTERVMIVRRGQVLSAPLMDITAVTAVDSGRRLTMSIRDGSEWMVDGRRGFIRRYRHRDELQQFREGVEAAVRASA
jgi:hypothetical protein